MSTNASLSSSSHSTDESSSFAINLSDKINFFNRIISLKQSAKIRSSDNSHNLYTIIVHFLDDSERIFYIDRHCKGIDLLNEIYDFIDLSYERKYFGLLIEDLSQDFSYRWLDSAKLLKKQLKNSMISYHVYFKVRYFPASPSLEIEDEFTKYLCVLQIKKEFLNGKIWCTRSIAALLASYIVQSELGDYNKNEHDQEYLNDFRFIPFQNSDFENDVHKYHEQHRGQTPAEAEMNYLRVASTLDMYGVELHRASCKISNSDSHAQNSIVELYVGVSAIGISIFQNSTRINIFSWDQITKISFKRRTFYIQLVKTLTSLNNNLIVFTLRNYQCCKYLWKSCVDYHTFFRLTSISSSTKILNNSNRHSSILQSDEKSMKTNRKTFERVSSRTNIRSKTFSSTLPIHSTKSNSSNLKSVPFLSSSNSSISKFDQFQNHQILITPPPKPPRQTYKSILNEYRTLKNDQSNIEILNKTDMNLFNENSIRIKLKPDIDGRYGFNIKGGKNEHTVARISRVGINTPASRASIHEDDIILAVNNIDIRDYTHDEILNLIRNIREQSSNELELVIKSCEHKRSLEESLKLLRQDLLTNYLIEKYTILQRSKDEYTFEIANQQNNQPLNRYRDVLPYDQTRVILTTDAENDYINASYIDMHIRSTNTINRYIATQGPLPTTCEHFWRMIWEQECILIIMLTTLFEGGRIKCHQYWPNILDTIDYDSFTIRCYREKKENELMYRQFILINKKLNQERSIYQIQYETWPDHGVPQNCSSFVDFVLEIRELRKAKKHLPILVHCSAGIGRTGVLILVETALCHIEKKKFLHPLSIVQQMREQRSGMIQTTSQYQFACEAILYAYDNGLLDIEN